MRGWDFEMRKRNGWILADAVTAMGVLGICAGILATAVSRESAGARKLSDLRTASRKAEGTLVAMQGGWPAGADVTVTKVGESAVAGMEWVKVTAKAGEGKDVESASLVGLVPDGKGK
jgi:hypothetical protein